MNYMKQVAEMLGVEMGEEFTLVGGYSDTEKLHFEESGLFNYAGVNVIINSILTGKVGIKKLPFRPKKCEAYYYISPEGYVLKTTHVSIATDCYNLKFGNCYRTREEAEKHKDEWVQFFKEAVE